MKTLINQNRFNDTTSASYKVFNSQQVIDRLTANGFSLESVKETKTKKVERQGFQKHFATLTHSSFRLENGLQPRLLLVNSYDGTTALQFKIGLFRLVCSNGLVVGTNWRQWSVRHVGESGLDKVVRIASEVPIEFERLLNTANNMQKLDLNLIEAQDFGAEAIKIRHGWQTPSLSSSFMLARRSADGGEDLFTALNIAQENLINGNYRYMNDSAEIKTARRLTAIKSVIDVNQKVWELAENYLTGKVA